MPAPALAISVVSHHQGEMVRLLLEDIQQYCPAQELEVILTLNIPENLPFQADDYSFPITMISNRTPMGFGTNHNQAFARTSGDWYAVLNPDLRFTEDPFPGLKATLEADNHFGVVAPRVVDTRQATADNARRFPTPTRILKRMVLRNPTTDYSLGNSPRVVDWLAGLFLLFPRRVFMAANGFDERYFLYFEDVELCARLNLQGYRAVLNPTITVIHLAQRRSHRRLSYLAWHLGGMLRFFSSEVYRALKHRDLV
jgi:N-acetylglucosaminyl-diphospho-decaprenol L-rhamnosyltransferase